MTDTPAALLTFPLHDATAALYNRACEAFDEACTTGNGRQHVIDMAGRSLTGFDRDMVAELIVSLIEEQGAHAMTRANFDDYVDGAVSERAQLTTQIRYLTERCARLTDDLEFANQRHNELPQEYLKAAAKGATP